MWGGAVSNGGAYPISTAGDATADGATKPSVMVSARSALSAPVAGCSVYFPIEDYQ